jgi:hypothetical protein
MGGGAEPLEGLSRGPKVPAGLALCLARRDTCPATSRVGASSKGKGVSRCATKAAASEVSARARSPRAARRRLGSGRRPRCLAGAPAAVSMPRTVRGALPRLGMRLRPSISPAPGGVSIPVVGWLSFSNTSTSGSWSRTTDRPFWRVPWQQPGTLRGGIEVARHQHDQATAIVSCIAADSAVGAVAE